MDDNVPIIHQYPPTVSQPLHSEESRTFSFEFLFDVFFDCFDLRGTFSGTDNEKIRDGRYVVYIEDEEILRFLIPRGPRCKNGFILAF